jgi:PTS system nitrogen regulatory IIA component
MQLTVREAARMLRATEANVYRWIRERDLPAAQFNGRYHFNRTTLVEWAHRQGVPLADEEAEALPGLPQALAAGGAHYGLPGQDLPAVLRALVDGLPLSQGVDRALLFDMLTAREQLGTTAFGGGVAIPHARSPILLHVGEPLAALGYPREPLPLRGPDGVPVFALFLLVSATARVHLHLLASLGRALQDAAFQRALADRAPLDRLVARLRELGPAAEDADA